MKKTTLLLALCTCPSLAVAQGTAKPATTTPAQATTAAEAPAPEKAVVSSKSTAAPGKHAPMAAEGAKTPVPAKAAAKVPAAPVKAAPPAHQENQDTGAAAPAVGGASPADGAKVTPPQDAHADAAGSTATAPPASTTSADATMRQAILAYNSGLAALKRNDWEAAGNFFGKAAALTPTDAGALSFLGYVRLQQKRYDEALTALLAAQETGKTLGPKAQAQLQNNIGFAYWNKNQFAQARDAFLKALDLDKTYYDARYNLAFALLSREKWDDALTQLKLLAVQNPKDASVQDGMGEAMERLNNMSGALGAYRRAADLEPTNQNYLLKLALALVQSDRRTEALVELRDLLHLDPLNAPALLQAGDIHLKNHEWSDAAAALTRYVKLRGDDFTGRFNLGVALDYAARFDEALAQYARAEQLRPNDAATKNNIGRIYFKRSKFDDAVVKFHEALKLDPNFADARTNLAIVLAAQGKYDDSSTNWKILLTNAQAQMSSAVNPAAKSAAMQRLTAAYSGLASNYLAQSRNVDAEFEYNKLIKVAPGDLDARSGLGRTYYQLQRYDEAEAAYREIIKRDPKNANAYNDLGVVLEAKNKRSEAMDAYRQALALNPAQSEAKSNLDRLTAAAPVG